MKVSGSGNGISKPVNPIVDRSGLNGEFADDYMAEGVLMSFGLSWEEQTESKAQHYSLKPCRFHRSGLVGFRALRA